MSAKSLYRKPIIAGLIVAAMLGINSCAALQPSAVNGPSSALPPYPIVANEPVRLESANLAWQQLSQRYGLPQGSSADLNSLTYTIQNMPANLGGSIFLPKVGSETPQTEEETRESLRRFIVDLQSLIGANPSQLSLVERTDDSSGIKLARYEQRPFRYPLRGEFGSLVIRFQSDRRVLNISSTCIPDTDRLQAALTALTPKVSAENAQTLVKERPITFNDSTGPRSFTLPATATVDVRQLVVYALPGPDRQKLELRLAWEIDVTNGPIKTVYLDALSEQVIAVI
jgi:hypothetical protein